MQVKALLPKFRFSILCCLLMINVFQIAQAKPIETEASAIIAVKDSTAASLCNLILFVNGPSSQLTIQNNSTTITALNIASNFTGTALQGNVTETGNTCSMVPPGGTCTLTFTPGSSTVPTTSFPIQGSNTNSISAAITIINKPMISITGPTQQSRVVTVSGSALSLQITNDASSPVNATGITVTNQASCPNLSVDATNCTSVAPGASCTLGLTSPTPYAPCTITVSGTNTANSPTTQIAFSYLGGLVFQASGGTGKVVTTTDIDDNFTTNLTTNIPASDLNNGSANTDVIVASTDCMSNTAGCAAQQCRNIGSVWYLPARNELSTIYTTLCPSGIPNCNFGNFSSTLSSYYWSSSTVGVGSVWAIIFNSGLMTALVRGTAFPGQTAHARCVQNF